MADTFTDDIFKRIFLNENVKILIQISLKFAPRSSNDNKSALVQVMVHSQSGAKPLPELMLTYCRPSLLMHMCGTRGRWIKRTPKNKLWRNFNQNIILFCQKVHWKMLSARCWPFFLQASLCSVITQNSSQIKQHMWELQVMCKLWSVNSINLVTHIHDLWQWTHAYHREEL